MAIEYILLLYEPAQMQELPRVLSALKEQGVTPLVVPLDRELELRLDELDVPYRSVTHYQSDTALERSILNEEWTEKVLDGPELAHFQYRSVPLTNVFFTSLHAHIQLVVYVADILAGIAAEHPNLKRLYVLPSFNSASPTTGYLMQREIDFVVASSKQLLGPRGIAVEVLPLSRAQAGKHRMRDFIFAAKRALFGAALAVWNTFIVLARPQMHPRLLVSEYWHNIEPIFNELPKGEILLLDRSEALKAGLATMWRFRMRFYHLANFAGKRNKEREQISELFGRQMQKLNDDAHYLDYLVWRGFSLRPFVLAALGDIVARAQTHTLAEIDGAYALLQKVRPDSILLRASVSAQTHFAVLAYVGRAFGVPSVELQHGLEFLGPGSRSARHAAEFIGVYGSYVQRELEQTGYSKEHLPLIGSPRFDRYAATFSSNRQKEADKILQVLCVAPIADFSEFINTYAVENYFMGVADAVRNIPDCMVTIKLRPGPRREAFYRELVARAFAGVPHKIAQYEPFIELFEKSDVVVSPYSTVVLEAMQCHMPTVLYSPVQPSIHDMHFHFDGYERAGAIALAGNTEQLHQALLRLADPTERKKMSENVKKFMEENYAFDGNATERLIDFFEHLRAKKSNL